MTHELRIEKLADMIFLADFYGPLLTEKQRTALRLFYEEDFSLGEIAAECVCSRQAAHDLLKRSEALLLNYEEKLQLVARHRRREQLLHDAEQALRALGLSPGTTGTERFWRLWQSLKEGE